MDDLPFWLYHNEIDKRNIDMIQETKVNLQHTKETTKKTHIEFKRTNQNFPKTSTSQRMMSHYDCIYHQIIKRTKKP
jgi:hypothetical protein